MVATGHPLGLGGPRMGDDVGLTAEGLDLVRVLARAKREGVLVEGLDAPTELLIELVSKGWAIVSGDPPRASLREWVDAWLDRPEVRRGRLLRNPDRIIDDRGRQPVMFGTCARPWREVHPRTCRPGCRACSLGDRKAPLNVSATRPPPKGDCQVCGGKRLDEGWVCGGCHREG